MGDAGFAGAVTACGPPRAGPGPGAWRSSHPPKATQATSRPSPAAMTAPRPARTRRIGTKPAAGLAMPSTGGGAGGWACTGAAVPAAPRSTAPWATSRLCSGANSSVSSAARKPGVPASTNCSAGPARRASCRYRNVDRGNASAPLISRTMRSYDSSSTVRLPNASRRIRSSCCARSSRPVTSATSRAMPRPSDAVALSRNTRLSWIASRRAALSSSASAAPSAARMATSPPAITWRIKRSKASGWLKSLGEMKMLAELR